MTPESPSLCKLQSHGANVEPAIWVTELGFCYDFSATISSQMKLRVTQTYFQVVPDFSPLLNFSFIVIFLGVPSKSSPSSPLPLSPFWGNTIVSENVYMSINFTSVGFSYAKDYLRIKFFVSKATKKSI